MKKLYAVFFAFMLQSTVPAMAQCLTDSLLSLLGTESTYYSYNGSVHSPKDTLHMLVIFRAFSNNTDDWNIGDSVLYWGHDDLPNWAKGASNKLFDSSHHTIGQTLNLSAWFHRMSKGKFIVTGEVFPHMVVQDSISVPYGHPNYKNEAFNTSIPQMFTKLKNDYPGFDWSKFDRRKNNPGFAYDNSTSSPDSILDYVFVVDRVLGEFTGWGGMVTFNGLTDTNNWIDYKIRFDVITLKTMFCMAPTSFSSI